MLRACVIAGAWVCIAPRLAAQRGPVFELQPGITVFDFVSVPPGTVTNSGFSFRFSTRFPTALSWLTPIVGATFLPYGTSENTIRNSDAPTVFAGNVFPLIAPTRTGGWLTLELPLVVAHAPGAASNGNARAYGRDLVAAPTLYFHLGARVLRDFGTVWSRLDVFAQLEQNLTPNEIAGTARDYFNPVATFGVSLTIGAPPN
jgi:hypothetical protein